MFSSDAYTIIAQAFPRLLGAIYFCAFAPFLLQIRALIGAQGILPASLFLQRIKKAYPKKCYFLAPSLFWINSSDFALIALTVLGTLLSLLLMCGVMPCVMLFCLYWLYLSIISVGQDFLGFGWELFLQEIAANTFLLSLTSAPNPFVWASLNLLLFRFHLQAGAVKLQSKDPRWRDLTAIFYHYQSQPLPNTLAWLMYKLPLWFHKASTAMMFVCELIVPFGIFLTQEVRLGVCAALIGLQLMIWLTGNFSYLNHMTAVFCLILLNDQTLSALGLSLPNNADSSRYVDLAVSCVGALFIMLQLVRIWGHFFPTQKLRRIWKTIEPFHIANRYGIFAVMTCKRYEIVIEASMDGQTWQEYLFRYKPSLLDHRPRRISPYQPRLDWQAWFLPFTTFAYEPWFQNFLGHLLKATPVVCKLLAHVPFGTASPRYVRALVYDYTFTSFAEMKQSGNWWNRTLVGTYTPIMQGMTHE